MKLDTVFDERSKDQSLRTGPEGANESHNIQKPPRPGRAHEYVAASHPPLRGGHTFRIGPGGCAPLARSFPPATFIRASGAKVGRRSIARFDCNPEVKPSPRPAVANFRRLPRALLELLVWSFSGALCIELGTSAAPADDPAAELASFKLAPGFEANLFASEADGIVKPIQSRFDARGRLWVVGSTVYPQLEPGQVPNDKVIILEDTDGDGRADKSTVFTDGLFIPTGIEIGDGGCYVGNSTELLHLRDNDGDDKADERRVVLRGFGTGDNHQNINSFQWSPGGELWFSQGLHAHSRVETPWGVEKLDQAGLWRLRPRLLRLDPFFGSEMAPHNPWGSTTGIRCSCSPATATASSTRCPCSFAGIVSRHSIRFGRTTAVASSVAATSSGTRNSRTIGRA